MKTIRIPSHGSPHRDLEVLDLLQSLPDVICETYHQPLKA